MFDDAARTSLGGSCMVTIAVDWSGARRPRNLAIAEVVNGQLESVRSLDSREKAASEIIRRCHQNGDTIVGLDFAFSLPAWFLAHHGLSSALELWRLVDREGERWLRDCKSPFWGRRGACKPDLPEHYRRTEIEVGKIGGISAKSTFQIGGAGAVGTGSLRGMPFLLKIRESGIAVWPFDPISKPFVLEIYPRLLTGVVMKSSLESRCEYIDRQWRLPSALRSEVIKSEDTFDAAVSALVMDRHRRELERLVAQDQGLKGLEGVIWSPLETRDVVTAER